jgi:hypothetical protein
MTPFKIIVMTFSASFMAWSCEDLSSFSTAQNEVYRGSIIQPEEVRKGFGKFSQMELTLNVDSIEASPGILKVESQEDAGQKETIFDDVSLRPIPSLRYDALSSLDFPTGRLKSYILNAPVSNERFPGADAMVILSLMSDGKVEVRVISGQDRLFGIFSLTKENR